MTPGPLRGSNCLLRSKVLGLPDGIRIMLHPPRLRKDLFKGVLRRGDGNRVAVKDNCTRTRCALIQSKDVTAHTRMIVRHDRQIN